VASQSFNSRPPLVAARPIRCSRSSIWQPANARSLRCPEWRLSSRTPGSWTCRRRMLR
jgi:hypothetical protein